MTSHCDPSVSLCPPRRPWLCTALGNILTWYCGGTGGRACWGAAESVLAEDGAGGRGTACLGCRGPGAELPPTEHRRDNGGPRERVECRKRDIQIHVKTVVNSSPPPCTIPRPHQAVRARALAPCAAGPGSHLLEAARAPAGPEEPPSQTEAEGQAAFLEKQWRSGSHATGRVRQEWGLQKRMGLAPSPLHGGTAWPLDHNLRQNVGEWVVKQGTGVREDSDNPK